MTTDWQFLLVALGVCILVALLAILYENWRDKKKKRQLVMFWQEFIDDLKNESDH